MALLSLKQMSPDAQALWLTNAIRKCEGCSTWTIKWNGDSFYEREEVFQCWDHEEQNKGQNLRRRVTLPNLHSGYKNIDA